jgi:hypothetical protein
MYKNSKKPKLDFFATSIGLAFGNDGKPFFFKPNREKMPNYFE